MNRCLLCKGNRTEQRYLINSITYFECSDCGIIFKDPELFPDKETEKRRYLAHNNDVNDPGYRKFVQPLVTKIFQEHTNKDQGLDFGAGPGPVIATILKEKGFSLQLYDPFFYPDQTPLERTYNYIICCEVIEHFKNPNAEFQRLYKLLKPRGYLYCMTGFLPPNEQFEDWYYKNDTTHLVFYSEKNLRWVQYHFGFSSLHIDDRVVVFQK